MNDVTKDLLEALKAVMPYVVTQVVACHGLKCRESVCESCTHDAEGNADKACTAYQTASEAIARAEAALAAPQPDALEQARAEEREACAKECDDIAFDWHKHAAGGPVAAYNACASAIRARGEK